MLIDPIYFNVSQQDRLILSVIGGGADPEPARIGKGLFEIHHFSFDMCLPGRASSWYKHRDEEKEFNDDWCQNPVLGEPARSDSGELIFSGMMGQWGEYGVCDTAEQFLAHDLGRWIVASRRKFIVSFSRIIKANQSPEGGWRWHKWGEYIGTKKPEYEYIYDEGEDIQEVLCFHVYELMVPIWEQNEQAEA